MIFLPLLKGRWGGIWQANKDYSFLATTNQQTNVKLITKFDDWQYSDNGIEQRMPWISGARLTTSKSAVRHWWGSVTGQGLGVSPVVVMLVVVIIVVTITVTITITITIAITIAIAIAIAITIAITITIAIAIAIMITITITMGITIAIAITITITPTPTTLQKICWY